MHIGVNATWLYLLLCSMALTTILFLPLDMYAECSLLTEDSSSFFYTISESKSKAPVVFSSK